MTIEEMKSNIKSIPPLSVMVDGRVVPGYVRGKRSWGVIVKIDLNGEAQCLQFSWKAIQKAVNDDGILMG